MLEAIRGTSFLPEEVIWNFSHYQEERRLTLAQNPYFYEDVPRTQLSARNCESDPIVPYRDRVYVLTGNSKHVFLHCGQERRAFDNVLNMDGALVLKGLCVTISSCLY